VDCNRSANGSGDWLGSTIWVFGSTIFLACIIGNLLEIRKEIAA
jgi:hypothetical protein